jgi:hypothetical protein
VEIDDNNDAGVVALYRKADVITGLFILTAVIEDILCE